VAENTNNKARDIEDEAQETPHVYAVRKDLRGWRFDRRSFVRAASAAAAAAYAGAMTSCAAPTPTLAPIPTRANTPTRTHMPTPSLAEELKLVQTS